MTFAAELSSSQDIERRVVRYRDLVPCFNAFIDSRTPGSDRKENFTIIGPGVSENPDQFVHIKEPHGFNIGGARQPPNCVNSQHSHETAEVFVVHSGNWRFDFGEQGDDAQVEAAPGDVVSFPIHTFRGFRNIGDDVGFLWAVLGSDDPGHVTWAPSVFQMASDYGLVLLENGALVDTTIGQTVPANLAPMAPTTRQTVEGMRVMTPADEREVIVRAESMTGAETLVIGKGGLLPPVEDFTLTRLSLGPGDRRSGQREVLFVQSGSMRVETLIGTTTLGLGDTMTVPASVDPVYSSEEGATVFAVRAER